MKITAGLSSNKWGGSHLTFKLTAITLVLTLAPVAIGQTQRKRTDPGDQVKAQVLDVYRRVNEATLRNDIDELDRLIADDFVSTGPRGEVTGDKRSILSLMKAGRMKTRYQKDRVLRVKVEGTRAVITGTAISGLELDGRVVDLRYKFSDVYEWRNGQWQNVLTHLIKFIPK